MRNCVRVPRAEVAAKVAADRAGKADQAVLLRAARAAMLLQLLQLHRLHQHLPLLQRPEHAD
jgi:hypothetical protein